MTRLLFAHPEWLTACAAVIATTGAALVFVFFHSRRRSRRLLGSTEAAGTLSALSDAALFAGLVLVALALLGPRFGHRTVMVSTAGVDTVVLLDVSRSMRAADTPPSRLDRAQRIALELLERLEPSDRVALAAYAGRGVVLTPLSPDKAALAALLPAIDTHLITPGGSNLRSGIEEALEVFDSASERPRVLVVLSDGEAMGRSGDIGAASAVRANVRVVSVALGSELGSTIPDGGAPLLDETQHIVISRRRSDPLRKLSAATDGRLFLADEWGAVDLEALTREVRRGVNETTGENPGWIEESRTVPLVLPFAALAFGLLWLECGRPLRLPRALPRLAAPAAGVAILRWLQRRKRTAAKAAVAIGALLPLFLMGAATDTERKAAADAAAWEALARARPLEDSELLQLGVARAEARQSDLALHAFQAVALGASDLGLAAIAYHDIGVLALEGGDLPRARDAFFSALELGPGNGQTRFNLEWTLRALAVQGPPQARKSPTSREPTPREPSEEEESDDSADRKDSIDSTAGESDSHDESPQDDAEAAPEEEPGGASRETVESGEGTGAQPTLTRASPLDADQRAMWLQRVQDDPSRALRSAASGGRRKPYPTW